MQRRMAAAFPARCVSIPTAAIQGERVNVFRRLAKQHRTGAPRFRPQGKDPSPHRPRCGTEMAWVEVWRSICRGLRQERLVLSTYRNCFELARPRLVAVGLVGLFLRAATGERLGLGPRQGAFCPRTPPAAAGLGRLSACSFGLPQERNLGWEACPGDLRAPRGFLS